MTPFGNFYLTAFQVCKFLVDRLPGTRISHLKSKVGVAWLDVLHLLPALSLGIRVRWQVCDVELSPTLEGHNQSPTRPYRDLIFLTRAPSHAASETGA